MSEPRSSAGESVAQLAVRVLRLEGLLTAVGDALAAPTGQSSARWRVLAAVEDAPRTVAQIARAWSLARQSVQRVADLLARDGLVTYEENPEHRRAKLVRLTPKGKATLHEIQAAQRRWADELGERLVERDLQTVNRILSDILDTLETPPTSARIGVQHQSGKSGMTVP
jgi:DNA-binding MarR family transcriptional regulator